jgi:hypothetical protein
MSGPDRVQIREEVLEWIAEDLAAQGRTAEEIESVLVRIAESQYVAAIVQHVVEGIERDPLDEFFIHDE